MTASNGWEHANRRLKAARLLGAVCEGRARDEALFYARSLDREEWDELAASIGVNPPSDKTVAVVVEALRLMAEDVAS